MSENKKPINRNDPLIMWRASFYDDMEEFYLFGDKKKAEAMVRENGIVEPVVLLPKTEMDKLNARIGKMAKFISDILDDCPATNQDYYGIDCDNLCGQEGRNAQDMSKCWLDYFSDESAT